MREDRAPWPWSGLYFMIPTEGATVIGRETRFRGEISGSTDLLIDGEVDGTIRLSAARVTVRAEGRVHATISAQDVTVAGHIEGEIRATGRVELRDGAVIVGDICASRLSIEEGATLRGGVDPTRASEPFPASSGRDAAHEGHQA
jgi:cytoskeletal protein CcmA (bactofilin family)